MLAIYWPVFLGHRFFWEDFFIQEYPIREYCFYMIRFVHELPFWNPYSWAWSPLLADAQSGFWYPTNLLQIGMTWLTMPHAAHLPVLIPETMTLLHLPLAALGVFVLLRKEFRVSGIAALLAGLCWGFGVRMAAEQNHSMQIIQLALLPWETLLLMRAWKSWRYAIGLGLLFGISFFAGQPQTFFFIAIFLSVFTVAETLIRFQKKNGMVDASTPLLYFTLAILITTGVACVQLLSSMELVALSARTHLNFDDASSASLHLGHIIDFFVPKFYGEYPGFNIPKSPTIHDHFWYWEATFYWGALAEILSLFAIIAHWKRREADDPKSRHLFFFVAFSIFALGFGLGDNFIVSWPIWQFVPIFDHFRAPNRMVWFLWFIGTLLTGLGLDILIQERDAVIRHKRFFYWAVGVFLTFNILSLVGVFDYVFKPHLLRPGLARIIVPSLVASLLTGLFLISVFRQSLSPKLLLVCTALLIAGDLWYQDFTWHRNTLDREIVVAQDSSSSLIQTFRHLHNNDHAKLLIDRGEDSNGVRANLGMFLRLPIEDAKDSVSLRDLNQLLPQSALAADQDPTRRMEIMGVATMVSGTGAISELPHPLSFLMLYHQWIVDSGRNGHTLSIANSIDFTKELSLTENPQLLLGSKMLPDTAILRSYDENHLRMMVMASQPSMLFVNDLFYPAWRATVDGKATKIIRAFTGGRAVPVTAGIHDVEMHYDSAAFDLGWKITLGTLTISVLVLIIGWKQQGNTP